MTILALVGSLRTESSAAALARAVASVAAPEIHVVAWEGLADVPLYTPDLDEDDGPPAVADLRDRIAAADAVLVVTPEYAHGMPGVLKNALDWLVSSGSLYRKPVASISASPSHRGGHRALAWLTQTLAAQQAAVPAAAIVAVPFVRQELKGDRLAEPDGPLADRLRGALAALARTDEADERADLQQRRYGLISKMTATAGQREALIALLLDGVESLPGCQSYVVARDPSDPDAVWITEVWDDRARHEASLALPSVREAIARARPLIAGFGPERFETEPVGGAGLPEAPGTPHARTS